MTLFTFLQTAKYWKIILPSGHTDQNLIWTRSNLFFQYYEFAYIKELAEPSRKLAQKVNQKEKGSKEKEETTEENVDEQQNVRDE